VVLQASIQENTLHEMQELQINMHFNYILYVYLFGSWIIMKVLTIAGGELVYFMFYPQSIDTAYYCR